jgi:hypothetical protein
MQACFATCIDVLSSGHKKRRTPALLQIHFDFSLSAAIKFLRHQTPFFLYHIVKNVNLSKTQEPFWFVNCLFLGGSWVQVCKFL